MSRRTVDGLIGILILALVVVLASSHRRVSGVMEYFGALISRLFE